MKSIEFCYWLQGLFELAKPLSLTEEQTLLIKNHLDMVFYHEIDKLYPKAEKPNLDYMHKLPGSGIGSTLDTTAIMRC